MSQSFKADYTQNHPTSFDTNYHGQSASYSRDSQYAGQHTQHESESKYSSAATYVANDDGLMPSYSSKQNLLDDPQSRYISVDPESQNPKASNLQPLGSIFLSVLASYLCSYIPFQITRTLQSQ
jgi:hypothetical protein